MNALILKELIEKAMVETSREMGGTYYTFSKEKFAEIIVTAAINECRKCWFDANNAPYDKDDKRTVGIRIGLKQGALTNIRAIKDYFGVK